MIYGLKQTDFMSGYWCLFKGQLISKWLFGVFNSSKKPTKTRRIVVKTNSFVRFLEEFMAWQFSFEIIWTLPILFSVGQLQV